MANTVSEAGMAGQFQRLPVHDQNVALKDLLRAQQPAEGGTAMGVDRKWQSWRWPAAWAGDAHPVGDGT